MRSVLACLFCASAALWPVLSGHAAGGLIPNFAPDDSTSWIPDRPTGDEFLPPLSGLGPVGSAKDHPYIPNGQGQPTYRIADVTNPNLKPWVVERLKQVNDGVRAGRVPFAASPDHP